MHGRQMHGRKNHGGQPHGADQKLRIGLLAISLLAAGSWAPAGLADGGDKGPLSKLTVHGFLTQAYADAKFADGGFIKPSPDEISLGIPEDGTFNYRTMAIQFRYQISPKDVMIIQFSSRALGNSPISQLEDEIELDWAFYERRLAPNTGIKVGRVQIPLGIFNEIRDVGTILPFYRPSVAFYQEGINTSETVDGVVLSHTFAPQSEWSLQADAYIGEWELFEGNAFDPQAPPEIARSEGIGFQLWLNTPVSGLRLGLGGHQRDVSGGQPAFRPPGFKDEFTDLYGSVDYAGDKFVLRGEYREFDADPNPVFSGGDFATWYAQIGYHPTEHFRIYVQTEAFDAEAAKEDFNGPPPLFGLPVLADVKAGLRRDTGVALNYIFSPNLVLKLEHHFDVESEIFSFVPVFAPPVPFPVGLQPIYATAQDGEYSILSFSASF